MPEWVIQLATAIGGAVTVYAGIRADLAALTVRAETALNSAETAHRRIDALQARGVGQ